jgi:two-component system sensor histidine kinase PhoQ
MTITILPIIGITLSNAFEQKIINSIKKELTAYSYSILAITEVEEQSLLMPEQLLENQFNVIQSGLYSVITALNGNNPILWHSNSLLSIDLANSNKSIFSSAPTVGKSSFSTLQLEGKYHFIYSFSASFSSTKGEFPLTVHIIKDQEDFKLLVAQFQQQLWIWLSLLMALFFLVQSLWLLWTLKPLNQLKAEMINIEQGNLAELQQNYPLELIPVTQQLNLLLRTERQQRKRYRHALADLAHSLKTPLAVIQSQDDFPKEASEQLLIINKIIEHQLKRAQSAGESSWHIGINISKIIEKLVNTMQKIHHDKALNFHCELDPQATFKGDEADLLEILGNIIDNACKAAKQRVHINVKQSKQHLTIVIADDGLGINKDQKAEILQRGTRTDTYQQGHGIGLAIVRDLVDSYQGQLIIDNSTHLLGAEFTLIF